MTDSVPRRAVFDDLRVGMWVAVIAQSGGAWCDRLEQRGAGTDIWLSEDGWAFHRLQCERGEVTILRDVPAAPVTVRRDDYHALVAALVQSGGCACQTCCAADVLTDNADTGDDA